MIGNMFHLQVSLLEKVVRPIIVYIGNDNSITGGIVGAMSLLTINWVVVRFLYSSPRVDRIVEGTERVLVRNGVVDRAALRKEVLTERELLSAIHRQGFERIEEIMKCVLEPNGTFYIEGRKPSQTELHNSDVVARLEQIQKDLQQIRKQLPAE
jgi:uncharacterized membrane protein YcaP (DUF421 family)